MTKFSLLFDVYYIGQNYGGDFANICETKRVPFYFKLLLMLYFYLQGVRLQAPTAKQQVKQTTVTRQMTEGELQMLMKRQQIYQQKQLAAGQNPQVQQIQVTQGQVTRVRKCFTHQISYM